MDRVSRRGHFEDLDHPAAPSTNGQGRPVHGHQRLAVAHTRRAARRLRGRQLPAELPLLRTGTDEAIHSPGAGGDLTIAWRSNHERVPHPADGVPEGRRHTWRRRRCDEFKGPLTRLTPVDVDSASERGASRSRGRWRAYRELLAVPAERNRSAEGGAIAAWFGVEVNELGDRHRPRTRGARHRVEAHEARTRAARAVRPWRANREQSARGPLRQVHRGPEAGVGREPLGRHHPLPDPGAGTKRAIATIQRNEAHAAPRAASRHSGRRPNGTKCAPARWVQRDGHRSAELASLAQSGLGHGVGWWNEVAGHGPPIRPAEASSRRQPDGRKDAGDKEELQHEDTGTHGGTSAIEGGHGVWDVMDSGGRKSWLCWSDRFPKERVAGSPAVSRENSRAGAPMISPMSAPSPKRNSDGGPLRVGSVPYLVGRPLDHGLEAEPGISLEHDVPARLIERLRDREIDVALVSSIELFRRHGYRYLDGLGVAGDGYVGSVQVFLRNPIQEVQKIAMDPASRAAAALTRSLLFEREGGAPEFLEMPLGADPREASEADAWLRIGDSALRETLTIDVPAWNPSEEWRKRTGMPFVFAAWIVREDVDIEPHLPAFIRAREAGRAAIPDLAREAAKVWQLPEGQCYSYLSEECSYDPGAAMGPSLREFQRRAFLAGLCENTVLPEPIFL